MKKTENAGNEGPPKFSGYVSAYHPAVQGSNPRQTFSIFSRTLNYICRCVQERTKIIKKRPDWSIFFKKTENENERMKIKKKRKIYCRQWG